MNSVFFINCEVRNQKYDEAIEFFEHDKHKYNYILLNKQCISDFIVDKINKKNLPALKEEKYICLFQKMRKLYKKIEALEKEDADCFNLSDIEEGFIIEQPNTEMKFTRTEYTMKDIKQSKDRKKKIDELMKEVSRIRIILQRLIFFERSTQKDVTSKLNDFMHNIDKILSNS